MAAGVVSAIALGAAGPASRLATWAHPGGERLAGATSAATAVGSADPATGRVVDELPPPFGSAGITAPPLPRQTYAPLPVVILPAPPLRIHLPHPSAAPPPAPGPSPSPSAAPAPRPTQPPAVLGPGSSTRAPVPATPRPAPRRPAATPTPTPPPTPAPAPAPPPPVVQLTGPAAQTLAGLDASRLAAGLGGLRVDPALTNAAVAHADQIAASGSLTHDGYIQDVDAQGVSWQGLGEVLGAYALIPDAAVIDELWMQSSEHRPIILDGQYGAVGIGWAQSSDGWWYVSAIFMY